MSLDDVKIVSVESITSSKYIQPMRVKYIQAGVEKLWDFMKAHDSVAILIFNITSQSIVLVRQFRPAVYMAKLASEPKTSNDKSVTGDCGVTYEMCAGLVDRDDPVESIACSEVLEETGYRVSPDMLELITVFRSGVGIAGTLQHMFYVEVNDDIKVSPGGGCKDEHEMIELFNLKLIDVKGFLNDKSVTNRPSGLLYGLSWFLANKT